MESLNHALHYWKQNIFSECVDKSISFFTQLFANGSCVRESKKRLELPTKLYKQILIEFLEKSVGTVS